MILFNQTKNITITTDLLLINSIFEKTLGYLSGKYHGKSLFFETRFGIHTYFLESSIDVIIADDNLIVKKSVALKPNRIMFWNPRFNKVIELPEGTLKKTFISVGDQLIIR